MLSPKSHIGSAPFPKALQDIGAVLYAALAVTWRLRAEKCDGWRELVDLTAGVCADTAGIWINRSIRWQAS